MYEKMFENSPYPAAISKAIDEGFAKIDMVYEAFGFREVTSNQQVPASDDSNTKMENKSEP